MSDSDLLPSPMSTPPSMRASTSSLPPPSPLATAMLVSSTDPQPTEQENLFTSATQKAAAMDDIPELTTYLATSDTDKISALKLVADSVAQQRQTASRALIFHPISIATLLAVFAVVWRYIYISPSDIGILLTTYAGLAMAALACVRWATSGYISGAEQIGWEWLDGDEVLVTRFGENIIGTCVFRWVMEKGRRKRVGRISVRAWTVGLRYRGKGVGVGLLEGLVVEGRRRGVEGVEFDEGHANSLRVLPAIFNGGFELKEKKARQKLKEVLDTDMGRPRKR